MNLIRFCGLVWCENTCNVDDSDNDDDDSNAPPPPPKMMVMIIMMMMIMTMMMIMKGVILGLFMIYQPGHGFSGLLMI